MLSNEKNIAQLCREHNISDSLIHAWHKLYRQKGEAAFRPVAPPKPAPTRSQEEQELVDLQAKVAELERFCGQLALENTSLLRRSTLRVKKTRNFRAKMPSRNSSATMNKH